MEALAPFSDDEVLAAIRNAKSEKLTTSRSSRLN
jgi:hypothetical protein